MSLVAHDPSGVPVTGPALRPGARRPGVGLAWALLSATAFGLSGALARGALENGWSPGALVLVRVGVAALVLLPFGVLAARRPAARAARHGVRRRALAGRVAAYGVVAVAVTQFCYFSAVARMPVGPALLIEFTAPAAVVLWLWLRHGEAPTRLTLVGATVAAAGLVLVLDVVGGLGVSPTGVLWALGAMAGCATYFVMSADDRCPLPPLTLAAGGLVTGTAALAVLGGVGLLPLAGTRDPVTFAGLGAAGTAVPWWVPLALLAVVTAAVAYASGIAAARHLGSRLASFVALLELLAGITFAWLLLAELPGPLQLAGGALVLAGVVTVKLGEPAGDYRGDAEDHHDQPPHEPAPAGAPQPVDARLG